MALTGRSAAQAAPTPRIVLIASVVERISFEFFMAVLTKYYFAANVRLKLVHRKIHGP
jgi:hypothetical protein